MLVATDMDMDIVETVAATVMEPGVTTVPAQLFYDIVRKLPEGAEIELSEADNGQVKLTAGRSSFSLPTLPVEDFPALSDQAMTTEFTLSAVDLKALIENTRFAVSTEETRYYLNGIYLRQYRRPSAAGCFHRWPPPCPLADGSACRGGDHAGGDHPPQGGWRNVQTDR